MRSTLLALSLLGLTCCLVGCDSTATKEETPAGAPVITPAPAEPGKGGMDGPPPAASKPEGAGAMTPAPAPEEKKDDMPK